MRSRVAAIFSQPPHSRHGSAGTAGAAPLDVDPGHLTLFDRVLTAAAPAPLLAPRRADAPNIVPVYTFDEAPAPASASVPASAPAAASAEPSAAAAAAPVPAPAPEPPAAEHEEQYWMKDEMCDKCYECHTPFTTFNRRHHCRVCGQVFCAKCCPRTTLAAPAAPPVPPVRPSAPATWPILLLLCF